LNLNISASDKSFSKIPSSDLQSSLLINERKLLSINVGLR